jgi:hypothetical protein
MAKVPVNTRQQNEKVNKWSLSDQSWQKEENEWVVRSVHKMRPACKPLNLGKKYKVILNSGLAYSGMFKHYIYKKETIESPLVRVYYELNLGEDQSVIIPEADVFIVAME